jgi:plasmid stabilization system protein ParE
VHKIVLSARAIRDIEKLQAYLSDYSEDVANHYLDELSEAIAIHIAERPHMWQFFFATGAPYRAYLFRLGRRTAYWIVYSVDESKRTVNILRIWNGAQDPAQFEA